MALAAEIVSERWTLLVLRELAFGSSRFNDIHRGVPRISPVLLTRRLRTLEQAGVVQRDDAGGYRLTAAGDAIVPTLDSLAVWGKRWLPANLSDMGGDPDLVMWDLHRRLHLDRLPSVRTTMLFEFSDQPSRKRSRWIVCSQLGADFCTVDPGSQVDLWIATDSRTLTAVWYGHLDLENSIEQGLIAVDGAPDLARRFPTWLRLSRIAHVD